MNPPSGLRQQQQKQKTLRMQKHENTLEFHSRLIEAAEGTVFAGCSMFFRSMLVHCVANSRYYVSGAVLKLFRNSPGGATDLSPGCSAQHEILGSASQLDTAP